MFGPTGPLLIELVLTIDGEPFDAPMQRLIDEVLRTADTNQDGVPTWDELTQSPSFKYGLYGNQPITTSEERRTVKQNYDGGDGRVDRYEVVRFLNSNQGSGRAFSLTSSNQYRGDNQTHSPLMRLLDWDEDGSLSADELAEAAIRLRSRDSDEDDILYLDDFKAASNLASPLVAPNMRARLKRYGPDAAVLLDENTSWNSLLVSLQELYALGGQVGLEPFAATPSTFQQLDTDGNGALQPGELAGLLQVAPHLSLAARFGQAAAPGNSVMPLELLALSPDLEQQQPVRAESTGRIALSLPMLELLVYVVDSAPGVDFEQQAQSQLMALDTDSNGYLDREELAAAGPMFPLEALDTDGDGKIFLPELRQALSQRQSAGRSQLQAYAADQEDALFSALDANNDGRLTTREIEQSPQRLTGLDRNQDGRLVPGEIPGSLLVAITRGAGMMNAGPPAAPLAYTTPAGDLPDWFRAMDANQDGELSRLEFLGEQDVFDRLDRNQDGVLAADESALPPAP
ncbi:MAG: hypothetical protein J5I93_05395 [Pirellulaceae bacterium]|nr:hypothetical protein [Pirellulaceae bacterium]